MTLYNVHIYREMRLTFEHIEAETPEAAAQIARDGLKEDADDIEDCNGEDLSAHIDVVGDDQGQQSLMIDFEAERLRKAAPLMMEALQAAAAWIDAQISVPRIQIQETLRAAIAKATAATAERRAG